MGRDYSLGEVQGQTALKMVLTCVSVKIKVKGAVSITFYSRLSQGKRGFGPGWAAETFQAGRTPFSEPTVLFIASTLGVLHFCIV